MAWWMAASMGLSVLSGAASYAAGKKKTRAQRAWQEYQNKQTLISNAADQNALTTNLERARRNTVRRVQDIQLNKMRAEGAAAVAAAAAGVTGVTVAQQALEIGAHAARQEKAADEDLLMTAQDMEAQRDIVARRATAAQDRTKYEGPSAGATLLGIGADITKTGLTYYR